MKPGAGVGAQADHVAGVRRDLGLVQDDVEHPGMMPSALRGSHHLYICTIFTLRGNTFSAPGSIEWKSAVRGAGVTTLAVAQSSDGSPASAGAFTPATIS